MCNNTLTLRVDVVNKPIPLLQGHRQLFSIFKHVLTLPARPVEKWVISQIRMI